MGVEIGYEQKLVYEIRKMRDRLRTNEPVTKREIYDLIDHCDRRISKDIALINAYKDAAVKFVAWMDGQRTMGSAIKGMFDIYGGLVSKADASRETMIPEYNELYQAVEALVHRKSKMDALYQGERYYADQLDDRMNDVVEKYEILNYLYGRHNRMKEDDKESGNGKLSPLPKDFGELASENRRLKEELTKVTNRLNVLSKKTNNAQIQKNASLADKCREMINCLEKKGVKDYVTQRRIEDVVAYAKKLRDEIKES